MSAVGDTEHRYVRDGEPAGRIKIRVDFVFASWLAGPLAARLKALDAEADANEKTPEGAAYKVSFEKKYKELVQECVHSDGASADKFETFTSVSETGSVEDMRVYWYGEAAVCIYSKLKAAKDSHSVLFPKPPHGSYWVKLGLNGAEFLATASSK